VIVFVDVGDLVIVEDVLCVDLWFVEGDCFFIVLGCCGCCVGFVVV